MKSKRQSKVVSKSEILETIPFDAWFYKQILVGKLRPEQKPEIFTFFKKRGLKDIEDPEKYNENIKYY